MVEGAVELWPAFPVQKCDTRAHNEMKLTFVRFVFETYFVWPANVVIVWWCLTENKGWSCLAVGGAAGLLGCTLKGRAMLLSRLCWRLLWACWVTDVSIKRWSMQSRVSSFFDLIHNGSGLWKYWREWLWRDDSWVPSGLMVSWDSFTQ